MAQHNELGKKGEKQAVYFLKSKGFVILETNWRHEKEEVDIVAKDGNELVIVEVKTRSTDYFGDPEEAVTPSKARRLIHAAEAYVELSDLDMDVRFDVVSIIMRKDKTTIDHIVDAFFASDFPEYE